MTKNQVALSSLAMDLKRVALGYYNGSEKTALRFSQEVLVRCEEVSAAEVRPYLRKILSSLPRCIVSKEQRKTRRRCPDVFDYFSKLCNCRILITK